MYHCHCCHILQCLQGLPLTALCCQGVQDWPQQVPAELSLKQHARSEAALGELLQQPSAEYPTSLALLQALLLLQPLSAGRKAVTSQRAQVVQHPAQTWLLAMRAALHAAPPEPAAQAGAAHVYC